ncbi:LysM peptidoglycan-binding domain-containing protein [Pseudonocardia spinosispora]|uniref:LysM peptidoglycan-binding domain-containing protein n=1 Tax=Pseudonocardia spinosispora TaxID=103441 RepID=UPI00048FE6CB|nr:LysM peptidoglycan-binding domain-containing protein [Pseudonocardia spinosispora]
MREDAAEPVAAQNGAAAGQRVAAAEPIVARAGQNGPEVSSRVAEAKDGQATDGKTGGPKPADRTASDRRARPGPVERTAAGAGAVTVDVTVPDSGTAAAATVSIDPARPSGATVSIDLARPAEAGQQSGAQQITVTVSDSAGPVVSRRGTDHGPGGHRDGDQPATPPGSTHAGPGPDGSPGPSATLERSGPAQPGLDSARSDRNDPSAAYNAGHDPDVAGPAPPAPTRTTQQHPADSTTGGAEPAEGFRDGLGPEDNCVACTRARLNGTPVENVGPATPRSQDAAEMRAQLEHDYAGRFDTTDRAGLEQRMDDAPEGTQVVVWTWEPGSSRSHWFTGTKTAEGTVFDEPLTNVRSAMVLEPGRSREQGPQPELDHPPLVGAKRKAEPETRADIPPVVHAEEPSILGQEAPARLRMEIDRLRGHSEVPLATGYKDVKESVRLGATREQIVDKVHALVAEAYYRVTGHELWDHQAVAAYELSTRDGTAGNVRGGGGKSIVLMMTAAVDALYGRVDIVTTKAMYKKDIDQARRVLGQLGIEVGLRERGEMSPEAGRELYNGHRVIYGAQRDVMFDVKHDMLASPGQRMRVQGPRSLIKDEIDYLSVEEARSPVVLADRADGVSGSDQRIQAAREAVREVDLEGDVAGQLNALSSQHRIEDLVEALHAERMQRDVDYMTVNHEVQTYSEESGTRDPGQRYNGELHSFVEAKEGLPIRGPLEQGSALSVLQFHRTYQRVIGASGTAAEAAGLLKRVYGMRVVDVPSTVEGALTDMGEHTWVDIPAKLEAGAADAAAAHETGRPFLVVSEPLPEGDLLRAGLKDKGIDAAQLNDRPEIVQDAVTTIQGAGQVGASTVATSYAGRGTDIVLSKVAEALGGLHVVITDFAGRAGVHLQKVYRAARGADKGSVVAHRSLRDKLLYRFADPVKHQALLDKYAGHPRNVEIKDKAVDDLFREARENATAWTERQVAEIAEHPERATTFTYRSRSRTEAPAGTTADAAAAAMRHGREVAEARTQLAKTKRVALAAPGGVLAADDQRGIERAAAELAAAQQRLAEALGHYRSVMAEAIGRTSLNLEPSAASVPADSLGIHAEAASRVERLLRDGDLASARALLGRLAWRAGQLADGGGNRWGAGPSVAAAAARALAAFAPSGPAQRDRLAVSLSELRGLLSGLPADARLLLIAPEARLWQQTIRDRAQAMRAHADDLDRAAGRVARDNAGTLRRAGPLGGRGDRISSRDSAARVLGQIGALRWAATEARARSERLLAQADRLVGWPAGSAPEHHHPAGVVAEHAPDGFPASPGVGVVDDAHAPRGRDVQLEGEHVVVPGRQESGVQRAVGLLTGGSARLDGGEQRGGDGEGETTDGAVLVEQDVVGGVARVGETPLAEHRPDVQGIDDVPAAQTLDQAQAGAGVGRRPERVAALGAEEQPVGGDVDVQGVGPGDHRPFPSGMGGAGPGQQRVVEPRSARQPSSRRGHPGVELGVEPGFSAGAGVDGFAPETPVGQGGTKDHPVTDPPGLADRTPQTHGDNGNHSDGRLPPATEAGDATGTSGSGGAAAVGGASHEAQDAFRQALVTLYGRGWQPEQHRLPFARGPPVVLIDRELAESMLGEPWRDLPSRLIAFGWQHPEYAPDGVIVMVTETWRDLTRPGAVPSQWWRRLVAHETGFHLGRPELVEGRTHEADERWLVEALPAAVRAAMGGQYLTRAEALSATARASTGAAGKAYGTTGDEHTGHDDPSHSTADTGAQRAGSARSWSRLPRGPPSWLARAGLLLGGATFTVGAVLGIGPTTTAPAVLTATSVATSVQQAMPSGQITVRAGDTLTSLAAHLGVSLSDLVAANPQVAGDPNRIAIGQRLATPASWDGTWTVRRGDTLSGIAAATGRSVPELLTANPALSADPNLIRPGQRITVVTPAVAAPPAPPITEAPPAEPTPVTPPAEQTPHGGWDPSGPIATLILAGAALGGWVLRSGLLGRALGVARDRLSALSQAMARWYTGATGAVRTAAAATVRGLGAAMSAVGTKARRVVPRARALWTGARSVAVGARGAALARRLADRAAEDGADSGSAADDLGARMRELARARIAARASAVAAGASPSLARRVMAAASGHRTGAVAVAGASLARSAAAWARRLAQVRRLTGAVASAGLAGAAWGWMWTTPSVAAALAGAAATGSAAWLGWNAVRARGSTARGWNANIVRAARVAGRLLPAFAGAAVLVGNLGVLGDFVAATVSASLDTDVTRAETVVKTVASLFAALIVGVNTGRSVYYRALRRAQQKDVHVRQLRDAVRSGVGSFGVNTMNYLLRLSVVVIPSGAVVTGVAQLLSPGSISASALVFLFAAASTAAQLKWVGYTRLVKGLTSGAVALAVLPLVTGLNISAIAADWPAWFAPLGLYLVYSSVSSVTGDVVVDVLGRFGQRWSAVRTRADLAITYYRGTSTTLTGWRRPFGVALRAGHFFVGKGVTLGWPMRWKDLPRGQKTYRMLLDWRAFSRADWRSMAAGVFDTMMGSLFGYIVSRPLPEPVMRWLAGPPAPPDPTAPPVPVAPMLDTLGYVGLRFAVAGAVLLAIWPLRNRVDKWFAKVSRLWRVPSRAFPFGVVLTRGPPWLALRIGGLGARTASLRGVLAEQSLGYRRGAPGPVATRPDRNGADSVARRLRAAIRLRTPLPPPLRAEAGDSPETRAFKRAAAQGWRELDRHRGAVLKQAVGVLAAELDGAHGALAWRAGRLRAAGRWDDVDTVEFLDELLNRLATTSDRTRGELEAGLAGEVKAFQAARIDFLKGPLRELALHQSREAADDHVDLTNRRDDDPSGGFDERISDAEQRRIRAEKLRSRVEFELAWERGRSYSKEGLVAVRELFEVLADEARTSARLEQTMRDRRGRTGTPKASELAGYRDLEALYTVLLHAAQLRDEVELIYSQRRWARQRWQARITAAVAPAPTGTHPRSLLDVALLLAGRDRSLNAADLAGAYGSTPEFWTDQLTALADIGAAKAVGDDTYRAADELRGAWRGADPRLRGALLTNPTGLRYPRLAALTKAAASQVAPRTRTRQRDGYRALVAVLNAVDRAAPYYKQGLIDWLFGRARALLWSYRQLRDPSVDPTRVPGAGGSARALRRADRAGLPALLAQLRLDTRVARAAQRHLRLAQNTPGLDEELLAWAHAVRGRTRTALEERIELVEHAAKAAGVPSSQLAEWTHRARQVAADPVPDPREELQLAVDAMWVAERALRDAGRRSERATVRYRHAGERLDQDRSAPARLAHARARAEFEAARDAYDTALGHAAATIVRWHHADRSAHKLDVVREFGVAGVELRGDYRERALRKRYPALGGLTKSSALESRRHPAAPSLPDPMPLVGANRALDTWRLITGTYRARHPEMFTGDAESTRAPDGFTKDQLVAGLAVDAPGWLADLDTRLNLTRPELDTALDDLVRSGLLTADWRGGPTYYRPSDRFRDLLAAAPTEFGDALLANPLATTLDLGAFGVQHTRPGDRLTNQTSTLVAALVAAVEIATLAPPPGSGAVAFGGLSDTEHTMLLARLPVWEAAGLLTPVSGPLAGMPRGPPVLVLDTRRLTREQRSVLRRVVAFAWNGVVVLTGEMADEIAALLADRQLTDGWWHDLLAHEVGFHLHATRDPAEHDADALDLTEALRSARAGTSGVHRLSTTQLPAGRTARHEGRSPARPAGTWNADHPATVHGRRTGGLPLTALDGATYQSTLLPEKTTASGTPRIVVLRTADGRTVVAKQHDPTVLINTVAAAAIYRLAGVPVPDTTLALATTPVLDGTGRAVIDAGDLLEVGDFVTGSPVRLSTAPAEIRDQLARQYAVTALLGDWDGTMSVNLVLAGGVVHRIDFDQALRNHRTHPLLWRPTHRPMIFGQLTEADVLAQFAALHAGRERLLAVVPNAELRRVVAGRLVWMGRTAEAGHLGQGLGRQLADDQRAHAGRFPHDRRHPDGYPSPPVGTAPHGFAATGTTRVVTGAQLHRLVARASPVWVHSARAGGRWQVTTTAERPLRLRAAWRLIASAATRILVAATLAAGLGGILAPAGVDQPVPVRTASVTAAPAAMVHAAPAQGRVFTAAGRDTAGRIAAGLGVSFADLDAANGGRFTGPGQRIGGQQVTAPSAWDGRWRIQPGDSLWRVFRVRFADPARYTEAVAAAGNRADLLYTADAPLTAQPPLAPQATPTAPITPTPNPGTPSPAMPVEPPHVGPTSGSGGWVLALAGAAAALTAAVFGALTWARRSHPRGGPVQPRGRSPPEPAVRAVRAEVIGFVSDVRAGLEHAFGADFTSLTHSVAWWQAGIANTVAALAEAPGRAAALLGRLAVEVRAQAVDLREQWRIVRTFADLPAWAHEPGTMPRRYRLRVGFELRVYFPGTNLAISEVFGSAVSSLVQHFTHLKVATTDEVDSFRARRAPATTRTSDGTRSRWAAAKSWMRTRIWERAGQLAVSIPLDTLATTGPIRLLSWLTTEVKAALTLQAGPLDDSLVQAKQPGDTAPGRFTVTRSSWVYGVLAIVRATVSTRLFDAVRIDLFVQPYTENGYQFLPTAPRAHLAGLHPLRWLRQWGMAHDLVLWTQQGLRFVVVTQLGVGIGPAGVATNILELRASMTGLQLLWRGRTYQLDPISGPSRALGALLRRAVPRPLALAATWVDGRARLRRETHRWHALGRIEAELHRQRAEQPRLARRIAELRDPRRPSDPVRQSLLRSALARQRRLDAAVAANERVVAELRAEPRSRLIEATRTRLLAERDTTATALELARLLLVRAATMQHTPGDDLGVGARLVVGGGRAPGHLPVGAHDVALNIEADARPDVTADIAAVDLPVEHYREVFFQAIPRTAITGPRIGALAEAMSTLRVGGSLIIVTGSKAGPHLAEIESTLRALGADVVLVDQAPTRIVAVKTRRTPPAAARAVYELVIDRAAADPDGLDAVLSHARARAVTDEPGEVAQPRGPPRWKRAVRRLFYGSAFLGGLAVLTLATHDPTVAMAAGLPWWLRPAEYLSDRAARRELRHQQDGPGPASQDDDPAEGLSPIVLLDHARGVLHDAAVRVMELREGSTHTDLEIAAGLLRFSADVVSAITGSYNRLALHATDVLGPALDTGPGPRWPGHLREPRADLEPTLFDGRLLVLSPGDGLDTPRPGLNTEDDPRSVLHAVQRDLDAVADFLPTIAGWLHRAADEADRAAAHVTSPAVADSIAEDAGNARTTADEDLTNARILIVNYLNHQFSEAWLARGDQAPDVAGRLVGQIGPAIQNDLFHLAWQRLLEVEGTAAATPDSPHHRRALDLRIDLQNQLLNGFYAVPDDEFWGSVWRVLPTLDPRPPDGDPLPALLLHWLTEALDEPEITGSYGFLDGSGPLAGLRAGPRVRDQLTLGVLNIATRRAGWVADLPRRRLAARHLMPMLRVWTHPELVRLRGPLGGLLDHAPDPVSREDNRQFIGAWAGLVEFLGDTREATTTLGITGATATRLVELADRLAAAKPADRAPLLTRTVDELARAIARRAGTLLDADIRPGHEPDMPRGSPLWNATVEYYGVSNGAFRSVLGHYLTELSRTGDTASAASAADRAWKQQLPAGTRVARDHTPADLPVTLDGEDLLIGTARDQVELLHLGDRLDGSCLDCVHGSIRDVAQSFVLHPALVTVNAYRANPDGTRGHRVARVTAAETDAGIVILNSPRGTTRRPTGPAFRDYLERWATDTGQPLITITERDSDHPAPDYDPEATAIPEHDGTRTDLTFTIPEAPGVDRIWTDAISRPGDLPLTATHTVHRWTAP